MDNDEKTPKPSPNSDGQITPDHSDVPAAGSTSAGPSADPMRAADESPTERLDAASAPAAAPAESPAASEATPAEASGADRKRRNRRILIGAGATAALLAFGGGAFAIGAAVADDDDDDRPGVHAPVDRGGAPGERGQHSPDDRGDDDRGDDDRPGGESAAGASAATDAAALSDAAEAAIEHASAEGATSIEIERGGYDIDVRLADGTERDLFVTPEGAVRERGRDDANDDDGDDPLIDLAELSKLLSAAQNAARDEGVAELTFHSLSTSSSGAVYEVELRSRTQEAEVELSADLGVERVDIDS